MTKEQFLNLKINDTINDNGNIYSVRSFPFGAGEKMVDLVELIYDEKSEDLKPIGGFRRVVYQDIKKAFVY